MRTLEITSRRKGRETKYPSFAFVLRVSSLFSLRLDVRNARRHMCEDIKRERKKKKWMKSPENKNTPQEFSICFTFCSAVVTRRADDFSLSFLCFTREKKNSLYEKSTSLLLLSPFRWIFREPALSPEDNFNLNNTNRKMHSAARSRWKNWKQLSRTHFYLPFLVAARLRSRVRAHLFCEWCNELLRGAIFHFRN